MKKKICIIESKYNEKFIRNGNKEKRVIKPSQEELQLHKKFLKSDLQKNFYN